MKTSAAHAHAPPQPASSPPRQTSPALERQITLKSSPQQPDLQLHSPQSPSAAPKSPAAHSSPSPSSPAAVPHTKQKPVLHSMLSPTAASPAAGRSPATPKVPLYITPAAPQAGRPAGPPQAVLSNAAAQKVPQPSASVAVPLTSPKPAAAPAKRTLSRNALPMPSHAPAAPPAALAAPQAGQLPANLSLQLAGAASTVAAATTAARRIQSSFPLQPNVR